jgi:hypothetical protein
MGPTDGLYHCNEKDCNNMKKTEMDKAVAGTDDKVSSSSEGTGEATTEGGAVSIAFRLTVYSNLES